MEVAGLPTGVAGGGPGLGPEGTAAGDLLTGAPGVTTAGKETVIKEPPSSKLGNLSDW